MYSVNLKQAKKLLNSKINNATVEFKNGKYYAVVNVEIIHQQLPDSETTADIDIGLKTFATLSNSLKIANLDVTHDEEMIKKIPEKPLALKTMKVTTTIKNSKKYWKWINKKKPIKIQDYIDKISHKIV